MNFFDLSCDQYSLICQLARGARRVEQKNSTYNNPYPSPITSPVPNYGVSEADLYRIDQDRIWRKVLQMYYEQNRPRAVDEIQAIVNKAAYECIMRDSYHAWEAAAMQMERENTFLLLFTFLSVREAQNQPDVYTEQDLRRVQQDFQKICTQIRVHVKPAYTVDHVMDVVRTMTETFYESRITIVDAVTLIKAQERKKREDFNAALTIGKKIRDRNKKERELRHRQMIMVTGGVDYTSKGLSLGEIEKMFNPSHKRRRSRF